MKKQRREADLIQKEYDDGLLPMELEELERLQRDRPLPPIERRELDAEIKRLKREGKWNE